MTTWTYNARRVDCFCQTPGTPGETPEVRGERTMCIASAATASSSVTLPSLPWCRRRRDWRRVDSATITGEVGCGAQAARRVSRDNNQEMEGLVQPRGDNGRVSRSRRDEQWSESPSTGDIVNEDSYERHQGRRVNWARRTARWAQRGPVRTGRGGDSEQVACDIGGVRLSSYGLGRADRFSRHGLRDVVRGCR